MTRKTLGLTGEEQIDISGLQNLQPGKTVPVTFDAGERENRGAGLSVPY